MISAWWLFLIVPVSAIVGFTTCAFLVVGKDR